MTKPQDTAPAFPLEDDPEPDRDADPQAHQDWIERKIRREVAGFRTPYGVPNVFTATGPPPERQGNPAPRIPQGAK